MPEYVYALHDFTPQVSDEIEFKVGDRIEVIEKDDLYGDGWWQVSFFSGSMSTSLSESSTSRPVTLACVRCAFDEYLGVSDECCGMAA